MGCYVKKTIGGYKEVPAEEADYYLESKGEHSSREIEFQQLKAELSYEKDHLRSAIATARMQTEERNRAENQELIRELQENDEKKNCQIETLKTEIKILEQEKKEAKSLTRNLLRIARERANALRGLSPKKEHDGYLLLSCRQVQDYIDKKKSREEYDAMPVSYRKNHRFRETERETVLSWKGIIQTPYDAGIPVEDIQTRIREDLENGILQEFGCRFIAPDNGQYPDIVEEPDKVPDESPNTMYRWYFRANKTPGLWELEIYTTGSLLIPASRRI